MCVKEYIPKICLFKGTLRSELFFEDPGFLYTEVYEEKHRINNRFEQCFQSAAFSEGSRNVIYESRRYTKLDAYKNIVLYDRVLRIRFEHDIPVDLVIDKGRYDARARRCKKNNEPSGGKRSAENSKVVRDRLFKYEV